MDFTTLTVLLISCLSTGTFAKLTFNIDVKNRDDPSKTCAGLKAEGFTIFFTTPLKPTLPYYEYFLSDKTTFEPTISYCNEENGKLSEMQAIGVRFTDAPNEFNVTFSFARFSDHHYELQEILFGYDAHSTSSSGPNGAGNITRRNLEPDLANPTPLGRSFTCGKSYAQQYNLSDQWYLSFNKIKYDPYMENGQFGKESCCARDEPCGAISLTVSLCTLIISSLIAINTLI